MDNSCNCGHNRKQHDFNYGPDHGSCTKCNCPGFTPEADTDAEDVKFEDEVSTDEFPTDDEGD